LVRDEFRVVVGAQSELPSNRFLLSASSKSCFQPNSINKSSSCECFMKRGKYALYQWVVDFMSWRSASQIWSNPGIWSDSVDGPTVHSIDLITLDSTCRCPAWEGGEKTVDNQRWVWHPGNDEWGFEGGWKLVRRREERRKFRCRDGRAARLEVTCIVRISEQLTNRKRWNWSQ
jgi:hypothetical protein